MFYKKLETRLFISGYVFCIMLCVVCLSSCAVTDKVAPDDPKYGLVAVPVQYSNESSSKRSQLGYALTGGEDGSRFEIPVPMTLNRELVVWKMEAGDYRIDSLKTFSNSEAHYRVFYFAPERALRDDIVFSIVPGQVTLIDHYVDYMKRNDDSRSYQSRVLILPLTSQDRINHYKELIRSKVGDLPINFK